ncbi:MAG: hypothetical protein Q9209_006457 [Squamulea sp. 1 TL-2023]
MQHLPFLPQKEIPYLGGPVYRGQGLEEFIKQHGWTQDSLRYRKEDDNGDGSPDSKLAFLQSLFNVAFVIEFFSICDVESSHEVFCLNNAVLDTSAFPNLIESWVEQSKIMDESIVKARVHKFLGFATSCMDNDLWRIAGDITLAMSCMYKTLTDFTEELSDSIVSTRWINLQAIKLLIGAGWCPRQIAEVAFSVMSPLDLYYLALKREHRIGIHTACTASTCLAFQTDAKKCPYVAIDEAEVEKALSQDIVPRVSFDVTEGISIKDTGPYVAFSHVWAHGLGNPHQNSLPACQLARLQSMTSFVLQYIGSEQTDGGFWIDTLCVPLREAPRKKALSLIRRSFREATFTLVLDYEIERLTVKVPTCEFLWRLAVSDWARRLWTFEEFVVSGDRVVVSCQGGLVHLMSKVSLEYKAREIRNRLDNASYEYKPLNMISLPPSLLRRRYQSFESASMENRFFFNNVMRKACNLSTSRWEDETLCLASTVDHETGPLAGLHPKNRMEYLLGAMETLPCNILFGHGSRSKKPGFTWAPLTFLIDHWWPIRPDLSMVGGKYHTMQAFGDLKGFDVMLGGYTMCVHPHRIEGSAGLRLPGELIPSQYLVHWKDLQDPRARWLEVLLNPNEDSAGLELAPVDVPPQARLILLNQDLLGPGILVQFLQIKDGIQLVKFHATVVVRPINMSGTEDRMNWRQGEVADVVPIPITQRWFIT